MEHPTLLAKMQDLVLSNICHVLDIPAPKLDLNASFTQLGGHSLSAVALALACKRQDLYLSVESILRSEMISKLLDCAAPMPSISCSKLPSAPSKRLLQVRPVLGTQKLEAEVTSTFATSTIRPLQALRSPSASVLSTSALLQTIEDIKPMTEMQLSLIHGSQKHPGTNIISFFETYASEDLPVMKKAWKAVIESEPIFRTTFDFSEGTGSLYVQDEAPFVWTEKVVYDQTTYQSELDEEEPQTQVGTSFKVVTFERSSETSVSTIIWRVHHALIDGFSASLIYKKLQEAAAGRTIQPGTAFDGIARDLKALQQRSRTASQRFWQKQQAEHPSAAGELLLPPPSSAPSSNSNLTKSVSLQLPVDQISACAREIGVSSASLYYAAWALALSMYTDSDAVVFGVVFSGRNLPLNGVEDTVGPLINTLPLHVSLNRATNTREYMRHIFHRMIELSSFQFSLPEDGYTRQFSSALAMEFEMAATATDGVQPVGKNYFKTVTEIPLSVFFGADGTLRLCYHSRTYSEPAIEVLGEHYRNALLALLDPTHTIGMCMDKLLSKQTREQLSTFGNCISNNTSVSSIKDDLVTLYERAVAEHPDSVAVEKGEKSLTYREFDELASRVANHLSQHILPGEAVCVHADRSINWIIAIYGILKAGGVYSAMDAALPSHVRDTNFQSAGGKIFLSSGLPEKSFKPSSCNVCFAVDELLSEEASPPANVIRRESPNPSATAYVCFTSGSTGKPKGVICSHEGLVAFQKDLETRLFAEPGCKVSQIMSPAFDGSIHEIFSTLSYGATLVLADSADPFSHLRLVDSAILTPSIAKILVPGDFPKLRNVYLVGEPVPQYVNDIWATEKKLYNMYGPTEGTCGATIKRLLPGKSVNIGPPNPSTRVYILDRNQCLIPPGVVGEIYIAGVQVARGYIGRPDETKNRFLVDTITTSPERAGERMYRTGDRAFWNESGEVECLGRNDRQIKLRGFRLDLNDLEIRMAQAVPAATAIAITPKDDYLVAMVQPASLDIADLRSKITKVLQVHAVPRLITAVDKFPMTPAGKLDYKAIAENVTAITKSTVKTLSTSSEKTIATAWREALSLGSDVAITGDSNFMALGGHSLLQLRLASRLSKLFGRRIPFRSIAQSATLGDLARAIDDIQPPETSAIQALPELALGEYEVSPMEREWWHKYELDGGSSSFNVTFACDFNPKTVDRGRLTAAWNIVMARHRILRCRYVPHRRLGVKRTYADEPPQVQRVKSLNVWKEIHRPFYLKRNDPIRVTISRDQMVVSISHIVCDLTTLQVLLREVASLYTGTRLPTIKRTYMDTSLWSRVASPGDLDFWTKHLENAPSPSGVQSGPNRKAYSGTTHMCEIPIGTYLRLVEFTETRKFTLHQLALAAVALALQTDADDTDIVLGGPYLNRPSDEDHETVGLFLEPMPIRVRYSPNITSPGAKSFIQSVQDSSQSALAHVVPWNQLLQHLNVTTDFPDHPLLDTMVTFHDDRNAPKFPIRGVEPLITWTQGSKFRLLCEFLAASDDTLLLRLEHDTDAFDRDGILRVQRLIIEAFECIVADVPYVEAKARLRRTAETKQAVEHEQANFFGVKLSAL